MRILSQSASWRGFAPPTCIGKPFTCSLLVLVHDYHWWWKHPGNPHIMQTEHTNTGMPINIHPALKPTLKEFKLMFSMFFSQVGLYSTTQHVIDTSDAQHITVQSQPIPFHYAEQVHQQLQEMAQKGIKRPSTSLWCAPAVYVPKGEICILCVSCVCKIQHKMAVKAC